MTMRLIDKRARRAPARAPTTAPSPAGGRPGPGPAPQGAGAAAEHRLREQIVALAEAVLHRFADSTSFHAQGLIVARWLVAGGDRMALRALELLVEAVQGDLDTMQTTDFELLQLLDLLRDYLHLHGWERPPRRPWVKDPHRVAPGAWCCELEVKADPHALARYQVSRDRVGTLQVIELRAVSQDDAEALARDVETGHLVCAQRLALDTHGVPVEGALEAFQPARRAAEILRDYAKGADHA